MMKINPVMSMPYKGKINTGAVTLISLSAISILGAHWLNKKTNKEVKK